MVSTIKKFVAKKNERRARCKAVKSYLNKVLYEAGSQLLYYAAHDKPEESADAPYIIRCCNTVVSATALMKPKVLRSLMKDADENWWKKFE